MRHQMPRSGHWTEILCKIVCIECRSARADGGETRARQLGLDLAAGLDGPPE